MKALFLAAVMMIGLNSQALPVQRAPLAAPDFDFTVTSPRDGLVTFGSFRATNGWPSVQGQLVSTVRWYYSTEGFEDISPDSEYIEQWIDPRDYTIPVLGMGNLFRGMRYYFKAGLATREGEMIYFTNDFETNAAKHSVVVQ